MKHFLFILLGLITITPMTFAGDTLDITDIGGLDITKLMNQNNINIAVNNDSYEFLYQYNSTKLQESPMVLGGLDFESISDETEKIRIAITHTDTNDYARYLKEKYPKLTSTEILSLQKSKNKTIIPIISRYKEIIAGKKSLRSLVNDTILNEQPGLGTDINAAEILVGTPEFIKDTQGKIIGIGYFCIVTQEAGPQPYQYRVVMLSRDETRYIVITKLVYPIENALSDAARNYLYRIGDRRPNFYARRMNVIAKKAMNDKVVKLQVQNIIASIQKGLK